MKEMKEGRMSQREPGKGRGGVATLEKVTGRDPLGK